MPELLITRFHIRFGYSLYWDGRDWRDEEFAIEYEDDDELRDTLARLEPKGAWLSEFRRPASDAEIAMAVRRRVRRTEITTGMVRQMHEMRAQGMKAPKIAAVMGLDPGTVRRHTSEKAKLKADESEKRRWDKIRADKALSEKVSARRAKAAMRLKIRREIEGENG